MSAIGILLFQLFLMHTILTTKTEVTKYAEIGKNFTLTCLSATRNATWYYNGKPIPSTGGNKRYNFGIEQNSIETPNEDAAVVDEMGTYYKKSLYIKSIEIEDNGTYTCENPLNTTVEEYKLQPFLSPKIVSNSKIKVKQKNGHAVTLYCLINLYPYNEEVRGNLKWIKDETSFPFLDRSTNVTQLNSTHVNMTLELAEVYKKENGSYGCVVYTANGTEAARKNIDLLVMDAPQVTIDYAKSVGANKIYLNWTVNDGNDPVHKYFLQYTQEGSESYAYYKDLIGGKNTSYVLEGFQPNTSYLLKLSGKNSIGEGPSYLYPMPVRTLENDPVFVPKVQTTGSTSSTITIGWNPPPPELLQYIQYYELVRYEAGTTPTNVEESIYQQNSRNLPYMFDNLKTATEYVFKVRACSDLTKQCGPWSESVNGTTMDGVASKPTELQVTCLHNNITKSYSVAVSWNEPKKPNGKVVSYLVRLDGVASYKVDGKMRNDSVGPQERRLDESNHKFVYESVKPNTNYTVLVSAITRHKKNGEQASDKCSTPIAAPDAINRVIWTKVKASDSRCVFKVFIPKVSERNGPICCYRLYLVRIGNDGAELPPPDKLNIMTYEEVHNPNNTMGGAYIAEMFPADAFKSEIFLADGKRLYDSEHDKICRQCLEGDEFLRNNQLYPKHQSTITTELPQLMSQRETLNKAGNLTEAASKILDSKRRRRKRRSLKYIENPGNSAQIATNNATETDANSLNFPTLNPPIFQVKMNQSKSPEDVLDGEIDMKSNYTGFLEVIVRNGDSVLYAYSNYFEVMTPGTVAEQYHGDDNIPAILNIIFQVMAILLGVVLVLLIILCFLRHYNTKNAGPGDETLTLRDSLSRAIFGGRTSNHRHFIGTSAMKASDLGPINKLDLPMAYKNRHKDTDYGFLREYEMLPNRFSDRTTKNSDMKENAIKNRYPDIKAYDQTRVKLSQVNGILGSDYINANFVIGYKERKKFICAQGPMESTVNDFWRMIWEQHLEIIVMLTNLEEYNKSKCAKYWPEKVMDAQQFGDITVKFVSEKRLGDYLIRNLDVFKRNTINEEDEERRQITQYHYLVWKDFMAPEHPQGIIKFIRHINAVYSVQRGPILVHCSAGVGRTGTLVALDSLMQQLEEENQVAIFNTVCDLRHQRNFLVQSLKQYIFLYRALLDAAQFGNTELSAISLSTAVENLKSRPIDGKDRCKLEIEFEKLLSITDETIKTCTVGSNETNISKNRSDSVIPYDRNRVILTPIPLKENSTYINASFIEGYDNSETFIITQDPMEHTIGDFWRMISEQSVSTLVMISEIGDGPRKCPRYWADDEIQYDHIVVKYMQSESCPYYTRREFHVTNCKIDDTIKVTQLQYNGWPTVEGEVPEVCRGMIELVDQAQSLHNANMNTSCKSPITVHCSLGTDRSSIFVAMSILVQQLRSEKSVDICSVTRKIRSQRPKLLNTYAQYEFLHRAIANYADLHKLSIESSPESQ